MLSVPRGFEQMIDQVVVGGGTLVSEEGSDLVLGRRQTGQVETQPPTVNHLQNWQSGWLPPVYQGTRVRSEGSPLLNLQPKEEYPPPVLDLARSLLARMDRAHRDKRPGQPQLEARILNYEPAARMQLSASDALPCPPPVGN